MDSIPMVIISGQVPTAYIGQDAFQEVDTVGITRPCVKHNFLVKDIRELASTIKKAFYLAKSGRPGPVLVDIPKDISAMKGEYAYPKTIAMRSYNPVIKGHQGQIKKAVQLLLEAKRPMIYTGGGVILSDAADKLAKLVRQLGFPVTNTLMGLGGYPATDKQFVGMLGMHGTYEANMAMQHCDVLLAVGARFDDRVIGNPEHFAEVPRKIIHIDIDPSSISKRVKVASGWPGQSVALSNSCTWCCGSSRYMEISSLITSRSLPISRGSNRELSSISSSTSRSCSKCS